GQAAMPQVECLSRKRPSAAGRSIHPCGSLAQLRHQLLEPLDRATAADPRLDRVPPNAEAVIDGLQIDAAVEIERRAILVELGAKAGPVCKHEVDLARPRQEHPADRAGGNALWALMLDPVDLRQQRPRLHGN